MFLFFDLDGTLTDPAPGITACFAHAAQALGLPEIDSALYRRFIGPPLREVFHELLGTRDEAQVEHAVRLYRERFGSVGLFENSVYPGVHEVLAELSRAGHQACIVTSKPAPYAERVADHFALREHLPVIYGAELSGGRSTKLELIALALEGEGASAEDTCMIGDREHDMLGAKGHGLHAIGVTWGYGSRAELLAAGADTLLDNFADLPEIIRRLAEAPRAPKRANGSVPR